MKKKLCAAILLLCMIVSLTACGATSDPAEDAAPQIQFYLEKRNMKVQKANRLR